MLFVTMILFEHVPVLHNKVHFFEQMVDVVDQTSMCKLLIDVKFSF